jgi:glycosyltransferase involved in cell wall biosynthesis
VVRGCPPADANELQKSLSALARERVAVLVRDYTAQPELIQSDLRRAGLLVMPSRHEGFGLVALEAIGAGIPVLVSGASGLGEHLEAEGHSRFVVPMWDEEDELVARWSRAIHQVLFDLDAAFDRAAELRKDLAPRMQWSLAANDVLDVLSATR